MKKLFITGILGLALGNSLYANCLMHGHKAPEWLCTGYIKSDTNRNNVYATGIGKFKIKDKTERMYIAYKSASDNLFNKLGIKDKKLKMKITENTKMVDKFINDKGTIFVLIKVNKNKLYY